MELLELKNMKRKLLDKYHETKDHSLQKIMRDLDVIIKRKVIDERIRTGCYTSHKPLE